MKQSSVHSKMSECKPVNHSSHSRDKWVPSKLQQRCSPRNNHVMHKANRENQNAHYTCALR